MNKAWEDILGYPACELQARKFLEFVHPDDLQATYDAMAALGEQQSIIGFANRYRCKDGSYRYIEWNSYPDGELIYAVARDVTDRKEKERALDAVVSEIQDLYEHAPCGYHSLDNDGVIVRINDTELGWLGYTREEVVGKKNFEEILTPKSKDIFRKSFPNQKKLGGVSDLEYDFVRKDGTIFSVILNASNIVDSSGNYIMSRAMSVDVTARKQFEEKLARDEKYLDDLMNSIEDVFYVLDARGNILRWNLAFEAVSGYTHDELAAMNVGELFAGADIDRVGQAIGKVFSTGRANVEAEVVTKFGKIIPMLFSGSMLEDISHQPVLCGIGKDIGGLKRREEELRASEARYRTYIEVTGQIAWTTPPDGVVDDIPEWRKYTGQTLDEVKGWGWLNAVHPDDREHTVERWNSAVETKSFFETEYRIRRSDGVYRYFISRGIPSLHADGTIHEWVGTCIDITDRREVEQKLVETNERLRKEVVRANRLAVDAEAANVAKSNFVANVSHEIRTPMNGILGFVHLLEQTEIDEEQAEIIQTIKDSTDTLLTVINDVLDMSKIEAGKMDIELIPFDLSATVEGVVRIFNARAREKGLEINSLIRTDVPQFVVGDPTRLKQTLINLVGNAVKFTEHGYVFVEVELKEIDDNGCRLQFVVRDTGIGINDELRGKLFTPFQQADSSSTRKYGGTGLGLVISKSITEAMGGEITFESTEGKGSVFSLTLPFATVKNIADDWIQPDYSLFSGKKIMVVDDHSTNREIVKNNLRILLVEDNEVNRKFFVLLLKGRGLDCDVATNGLEAIAAWQKNHYDLIFMDCQMPVMDGYEATRKIRELEAGRKHTPIVAMTAFAMKGDAEKCLAAGMDEYLSKPVDVEKLMKLIRKYSGNSVSYYDRVLQRLVKNAGFDETAARELLDEGIPLVKASLDEIEARFADQQLDEVDRLLHQFKGATGNLRMSEVAETANAAEVAAKAGDMIELKTRLRDVKAQLELL